MVVPCKPNEVMIMLSLTRTMKLIMVMMRVGADSRVQMRVGD